MGAASFLGLIREDLEGMFIFGPVQFLFEPSCACASGPYWGFLTSFFIIKIVAETGKKSSGKGSRAKKSKGVPSDEELQAKIRKLLREADFSKVSDGNKFTRHYILNGDSLPILVKTITMFRNAVTLMEVTASWGCSYVPMDAVIYSNTIIEVLRFRCRYVFVAVVRVLNVSSFADNCFSFLFLFRNILGILFRYSRIKWSFTQVDNWVSVFVGHTGDIHRCCFGTW